MKLITADIHHVIHKDLPAPIGKAKLGDRHLVFLDTETTALNPVRGSILEVALLRVHPDTLEIIEEFQSYVCPKDNALIDPKAFEINGIDLKEVRSKAPKMHEVMPKVCSILAGTSVVGQHVDFDWQFLAATFQNLGICPKNTSKFLIELTSLAWPLLRMKVLPKVSLSTLCDYFGISNDGAHGAMADARRTYLVYKSLIGILTRHEFPAPLVVQEHKREHEPLEKELFNMTGWDIPNRVTLDDSGANETYASRVTYSDKFFKTLLKESPSSLLYYTGGDACLAPSELTFALERLGEIENPAEVGVAPLEIVRRLVKATKHSSTVVREGALLGMIKLSPSVEEFDVSLMREAAAKMEATDASPVIREIARDYLQEFDSVP